MRIPVPVTVALVVLLVVALVACVVLAVVQARRLRILGRRASELESTAERYGSLFDQHPHGVFSVGLDGRFTSVNAAAERLCGWSAAELRETTFSDLLHPDSHQVVADAFVAVLGGVPQSLDCVIRHRRGRLVPLALTGMPILVDREVVGVYGVARDVTRQDGVLRELERANLAAARDSEAKAAFLATVSHEIRTPLTGVLAASELLADTELDPLQQGVVDTLGRAGHRLQRLVDNVLDFSKLDAGKVELEVADVDVRELAEEAVEMFVHAAGRKGVALTHHVADDVPDLLAGDSSRIAQVLQNLVGNAVKFTSAGSVAVRVDLPPDPDPGAPGAPGAPGDGTAPAAEGTVSVRFAVVDTGIGMSAEQRGRLFQSFSQADPSITRRYGGTGLGLVISRTLVHLMGGTIDVSSAEGSGSTFAFRVPLLRERPEPPRTDDETPAPGPQGDAPSTAPDTTPDTAPETAPSAGAAAPGTAPDAGPVPGPSQAPDAGRPAPVLPTA